ncbi:hypothetical protein N9276_00445 [Rhodopirellula sp.]|nr:hypothetical protein [Rhodopirellula sp.]
MLLRSDTSNLLNVLKPIRKHNEYKQPGQYVFLISLLFRLHIAIILLLCRVPWVQYLAGTGRRKLTETNSRRSAASNSDTKPVTSRPQNVASQLETDRWVACTARRSTIQSRIPKRHRSQPADCLARDVDHHRSTILICSKQDNRSESLTNKKIQRDNLFPGKSLRNMALSAYGLKFLANKFIIPEDGVFFISS